MPTPKPMPMPMPFTPAPDPEPAAASPGRIRAGHGAPAQRRLDSRELLGAAQEVEIEHAGSVYRLRQTALGKLILTK